MRQIEIIIREGGELTIDAIGFKGSACEAATAALEAELGLTRSKKKKPEYHAQATSLTRQTT